MVYFLKLKICIGVFCEFSLFCVIKIFQLVEIVLVTPKLLNYGASPNCARQYIQEHNFSPCSTDTITILNTIKKNDENVITAGTVPLIEMTRTRVLAATVPW